MAVTIAGPRVLALLADMDACNWWRYIRPAERLAERGYPAAWGSKDDPRLANIAHLYDAVVLPRLSWHDHLAGRRFIDALHRAGLTVIYEVDDDLYSPHIKARLKATLQKEKSEEELERKRLDRLAALRLCDGVTVSSQRLATVMRTLVDMPVVCVPNAIDVPWWRHILKGAKRRIKPLVIGWAGGSRPEGDFDAVATAWGRIARRYPHVTFAVMGFLPDVLTQAVPRERLRPLPWLPLDSYPRGMHEFDIACASVQDSPFNRAKTPIKLWESTLAGAACVVSRTLYGPYVENGVDGFIAETADEWEAGLAALVEDDDLRARFRRRQTRRIEKHHSLETQLWRWPAAWNEIVAHHRAQPQRPTLWLPGSVAA